WTFRSAARQRRFQSGGFAAALRKRGMTWGRRVCYDGPMAVDSLGRPLRDLRISVTDRCNFRCTYCMPREIFGPHWDGYLPREALLTFEEIARLARLFV